MKTKNDENASMILLCTGEYSYNRESIGKSLAIKDTNTNTGVLHRIHLIIY